MQPARCLWKKRDDADTLDRWSLIEIRWLGMDALEDWKRREAVHIETHVAALLRHQPARRRRTYY